MHGVAASGKAGTVHAWTEMVSSRLQRGGWRPARLVTAHDGADIQPFSSSFTALVGEKVSFRAVPIFIYSPLVGLRPSRPGVSSTLQFPNPGSEISAPFAAGLVMLSRDAVSSMLSTIGSLISNSDRLRRPDCIRGGVDCSGRVCCRTCFKNIGPRDRPAAASASRSSVVHLSGHGFIRGKRATVGARSGIKRAFIAIRVEGSIPVRLAIFRATASATRRRFFAVSSELALRP